MANRTVLMNCPINLLIFLKSNKSISSEKFNVRRNFSFPIEFFLEFNCIISTLDIGQLFCYNISIKRSRAARKLHSCVVVSLQRFSRVTLTLGVLPGLRDLIVIESLIPNFFSSFLPFLGRSLCTSNTFSAPLKIGSFLRLLIETH